MKSVFAASRYVGALLLAVLIATIFQSVPASAQTSNNAAQGLEISPAAVELNAEAGKTYTLKLTVTNVTVSDLFYTTSVNDFTSKDETGTPSISLDSDKPTAASIQAWVAPLSDFTLKTRQTKEIIVTINVPKDAEPGGHYGVIRFSGEAPEVAGTGVGLSASAGALVLVRVAGAVDEDLELVTFTAEQPNIINGFTSYGPVVFTMRFENKGNVHVKPIGQIDIHDAFGNKVETVAVNPEKGNILPLSIRRFESSLNKDWMFGRYTADISVAYGTTGQAIVKSIEFWVIPYKLIGVVILALATLIFVFRTFIKRYNNYIIKRASQQHGKKTKTKKK